MQENIKNVQIWLPLLLTLLAGLSTVIGSLISLSIKELKRSVLQFFLGLSAGVMVYISFVELLRESIENIGFLRANFAFFCGIAFILILDFFTPHRYIEEQIKLDPGKQRIMKAGIFTALGIAIHNLPEGLAVFISSLGDIKLGAALAFAIAIHNIPEGIAIAVPIYFATKNKAKAFWYSLFAGITEPIGALIGLFILMPFLNKFVLSFFFAIVAGIMVFISFDELLPLSFKEEGSHLSILGVISGMLLMSLSLYLF